MRKGTNNGFVVSIVSNAITTGSLLHILSRYEAVYDCRKRLADFPEITYGFQYCSCTGLKLSFLFTEMFHARDTPIFRLES